MKHFSILTVLMCVLLGGCGVSVPEAQHHVDETPSIYPDYVGVTIPTNVAPLRFMVADDVEDAVAVLLAGECELVEKADEGKFLFSEKDWSRLMEAAKGADVLYTDVWASMGQEAEAEERKKIFKGYQINSNVMAVAHSDAMVLHCLPAHRGEEIAQAQNGGRAAGKRGEIGRIEAVEIAHGQLQQHQQLQGCGFCSTPCPLL